MNRNISIDGRKIGDGCPPYIICEMSANHNGDLDQALRLIEAGQRAGADAIKIQTYLPETMTLDSELEDFQITEGLWQGKNLYRLYEEAYTPWEWHKPMFEHANRRGITLFSTPFDSSAVDLLEDLNAPAYKIASFEVIDTPLIRYVASTGKPMIISTGMADEEEIAEAIETARSAGCNELAVLHCVSGYPAPAKDYNLLTIPDMIERHGLVTGLSDHTLDNTTAIASIALGASIIEKHFTLDRNGGGPDDSFSLEPKEFEELCSAAQTTWKAMGDVDYGFKSSEKGNIRFRRSLYFVRDLDAGHIVTENDIKSVRPGFGLPPKQYENLIGKELARKVLFATPCKWDDFKGE